MLSTWYAVPGTTNTSAIASAGHSGSRRPAPSHDRTASSASTTSGSTIPWNACAGNVPNGCTKTNSAAIGHTRSATSANVGAGSRYANAAGTASGASTSTATHQGQTSMAPRAFASPASSHEESKTDSSR